MEKKTFEKIVETVQRLRKGTVFASGLPGGGWEVMLTPDDVHQTNGPRFWQTCAELKFDPDEGTRSLYSETRTYKRKAYNLHVYAGGLKFPEVCPVTLEDPSHYEIIETQVRRILSFPNIQFDAPQKKVDRYVTATTSDRYWYAIPFSRDYGPSNHAVGFEPGVSSDAPCKIKIRLLNREYARRFTALNNLEGGRWLAEKHVLMKAIGFVGMIVFFAVAGAIGLSLLRNFNIFSRGLSIALIIFGIVLGAISTFYFVKGWRGEPL
jgi:hypothetical protein